MNNDIEIIKTLKRNFISEIMSYGVQYETCGKISAALNAAIESLSSTATPPVLAAPANSAVLELLEPVAYLKFWAAQSWGGSGNQDIDYGEGLATCEKEEVGDDKLPAFAVYTADQLRAAVLAERSACAVICDRGASQMVTKQQRDGAARCASIIRART